MAITLASDEYDEIRLLIDGDIDEDDLTDDRQINADTVLGASRIVCAVSDTGRHERVDRVRRQEVFGGR